MLMAVAFATAAMADPVSEGRAVFGRCSACHSVNPGEMGLGPSLAGVVGRRVASLPGYDYSAALRQSDFVWTPEMLDRWLTKPQAVTPRTRMAFAGVSAAADRQKLIAYLATLK